MRRAATSPPAGPAPDVAHWTGRTLADVARECDAIRDERGLPDMILRCLFTDIAAAGIRADTASCAARHLNKLSVCGTCSWCCAAPERAARTAAYQRARNERLKERAS